MNFVQHDGRLEVVITTLNAERGLRRLVNSLLGSGVPAKNIIVVDGGSHDNTVTIARDLEVRVEATRDNSEMVSGLRSADSIAEARNVGLGIVTSPRVVFLDADMELNAQVIAEIEAELDRGARAVILPEIAVGQSYLAKIRRWQRECRLPGDAALAPRAFDTATLRQFHGYRNGMSGLEDLELSARITETSLPIAVIATPISHHEEESTLREYIRKRWKYSLASPVLSRLHPEYAKRLFAVSPRLVALGHRFKTEPNLGVLVGALALWMVEGLFAIANLSLGGEKNTA